MWISKITTVEHTSGAPLFRKFGVGPKLIPVKAIYQLLILFTSKQSKKAIIISVQLQLK